MILHGLLVQKPSAAKYTIIRVLQPEKGYLLPMVIWRVKDEMGSELRSPDSQTQAFHPRLPPKTEILLPMSLPGGTVVKDPLA